LGLNKWLTGLALLLSLSLALFAKDPKEQGFSGKWSLIKDQSHSTEPLPDLHQQIKVKGSEVTIQNQFPEPANGIAPLVFLGIMTTSLRLNTDGTEVTNQIGPFAYVSKTTVDGNTMTTDWHAEVNGDPVQGKWVRTLSDDGRQSTLTITETSTKGQNGNATLVFKRK
jgi:hypothetical protein